MSLGEGGGGSAVRILPFLANVGSVSPYVGLFGTVWGIINSFQGLSDATQATINAVAPGISEALVATALGLICSDPSRCSLQPVCIRLGLPVTAIFYIWRGVSQHPLQTNG